jgi:hypothetical protein
MIPQQSYGLDHPAVADGLTNLATLLQETDRLQEAEPLLRRALAINDSNVPQVLNRMTRLAMSLIGQIRSAAFHNGARRLEPSVNACRMANRFHRSKVFQIIAKGTANSYRSPRYFLPSPLNSRSESRQQDVY